MSKPAVKASKKRGAPKAEKPEKPAPSFEVSIRSAAFHFPEGGISTSALVLNEQPHRVFFLRERRNIGVKYVHTAALTDTPSSLATTAAQNALARGGIDPSTLDMVVTAGCTPPDFDMWSMPTKVAKNIGALNAECFGIGEAGCASAFAAMRVLVPMMLAPDGPRRVMLVAGCITPGGHFFPPATIYGDGAGALILERTKVGKATGPRVIRADYYTDCQYIESFGPVAGLMKLRLDGQLVPADWTVRIKDIKQMEVLVQTTAERGASFVKKTLKKARWTPEDLRWLILDNVAAVVPEVMAEIFALPQDRVLLENIRRYGHAWVVDMFVNLATIFDEHPLAPAERIVCAGMGQGEHWGVMLLEN